MSSQVKCRYCGEMVNKDSAYQDKERRGYYFCNHEHFIKDKEKVAKKAASEPKVPIRPQAYNELIAYVYELYNKNIPSFVFKQISDMTKRTTKPFTYKGIELSLRYWVDTLNHGFDRNNGLGIVEYVYDEAEQFWKDRQRVARAAQEMKKDDVITQNTKTNVEALKYRIKKGSKRNV